LRLNTLPLGALTLLLLIAVPVNAAPALHKGSQTSYNLSVSISFLQSCGPVLGSALSAGIVCPMIAIIQPSLNLNGTLGWAVTDLNVTTATLNVTRDITPSSAEFLTPITHHTGSINESINLVTRIASFLPFIEPEVNQAMQMAQTNMASSMLTGTSWSSTMSAMDATTVRQPLHTMWWVNGPLKVNDTVPVLVFPTNVTSSMSLNLGGSIGTRSAWTLAFPRTGSFLPPDPTATMTSSIPIADNFEFALTFNYDQTSDLLLTASADIHLGFSEETTIQPSPCVSSATTVCPASIPISIMREFGIDVQASLKLASTTLDLSQRLTPTIGSESGGGSSSGTGAGNGSGSGIGSGSGSGTGTGSGQGSGSGSGTGSNSRTDSGSGSGSSPGSSVTLGGSGQPASNPAQPKSQSDSLLPWVFGILGIIAAVIVATGVWIARIRMKKSPSQIPAAQPSA